MGDVRRAARGSLGSWLATVLALAWARAWGARIRYDESARMFVCSGMRGGFARGGTAVGGVFLSRREPGPRLLRHEAVHADQWARHGLAFPLRYLLEERRRPGPRNRFEVEAGLRDGGYRPPVT
ncbi:hypothetical protein [Nocardioides dongkuii]|uniref:hypothetical protein n=1 Tax=Nocardioides dongkuii TaxID=2760089 RepID=UPI0015FBA526|nr:hypothetical protein [Nocardioides dongkuii]